MKVQCVICDAIEDINGDSILGKKLRNHPLVTHMCQSCRERIAKNTEKRRQEGRLPALPFPEQEDDW